MGPFSFTALGTGFYKLKAYYTVSGYYFERSLQLVNGQSNTVNIDLAGTTYSISGQVDANASTPYNSRSYLVNQTTPTTLYLMSGSTSTNAAGVLAKRYNRYEQGNNQGPSGGSGSTSQAPDPTQTFFGFFDATSGTYTITGLTPGTYELFNNAELNNDVTDGNEIAETKRLVTIINQDLTQEDFSLTDGYQVSGTLSIDSGDSEPGRSFQVQLDNSKGQSVQKVSVFLTGTSASFQLTHVPVGSYLLKVQDYSQPQKYSAKDIPVTVDADVSNQDIRLLSSAKIQGQLRVKKSGELLTSVNYSNVLSNSFYIEARSNPCPRWIRSFKLSPDWF